MFHTPQSVATPLASAVLLSTSGEIERKNDTCAIATFAQPPGPVARSGDISTLERRSLAYRRAPTYHPPVPNDLDILQTAARMGEEGRPFILITVVSAKGSTPRNVGAKMIWHASADASGTLVGTVGGGQFELLAIDAARKHMAARSSGVERYVLGSDADQCCGGVMEVYFEYYGRAQRIVIFGAGHVARELAHMLEPAGHELVIADDRPEWNSPDRFPGCRRFLDWSQAIAHCHAAPTSTLACVMTCSHDTDFELLRQLLSTPPAFLGLIGSRSKRICLFGRLAASGIDPQVVQKVHCPIGIGDLGKEPRLVAISMASQLLQVARTLPRLP
jgi:xanthine dehydrogenase accessory factor